MPKRTAWTKSLSKDLSQYIIKDSKGNVMCRVKTADYKNRDASEFVKTAEMICLLGLFVK